MKLVPTRAGRRPGFELVGAHVVITGAARGVGEALARAFATAGSNLTLLDRDDPMALAREVNAHGVQVDLSHPDGVVGLVERIEADGGPIDLLVNNAAMAVTAPFVQQRSELVRAQILANLWAPLELTHQVLPGMLSRRRGGIVMISSLASEISIRNSSTYAATKAGISAFTLTVQRELARSPIRTLLVILGEVNSPMGEAVREDPVVAALAQRLGRLGPALEPERIAHDCLKAFQGGKQALVLPPSARGMFELRQLPNRAIDLAMLGIG